MDSTQFKYFKSRHESWIKFLWDKFPESITDNLITSKQIAEMKSISKDNGFTSPSFFTTEKSLKVSRGEYNIPDIDAVRDFTSNSAAIMGNTNEDNTDNDLNLTVDQDQKPHIPLRMKGYHNTTNTRLIKKGIAAGVFHPMFLSGHTGIGKTTAVEQVCAMLGRGLIRANITHETDEMDLIGGWSLVDGNTVFEYGPVVEAMRTGSILLIDEIDLGTPKIMCLQGVLEGKAIYIKKTGEWIKPKKGFNVIATGNTKGSGDDSGKFIGHQHMNEALMDRFEYWIDVDYPTKSEETKILEKHWKNISGDVSPDVFIENLVRWANEIRKSYSNDDIQDVISTRRLIGILSHQNIFKGKEEATIRDMVNRYDINSQSAFMRHWEMITTPEPVEVPDTVTPTPSVGNVSVESNGNIKTWTNTEYVYVNTPT